MNAAIDESEKLKFDTEECEKTDAEKNEEEAHFKMHFGDI